MPGEAQPTQSAFGHVIAPGANAAQIADIVVITWRRMDGALSPIIGQRGVAVLFERSSHLTRARFPWLPSSDNSPVELGDLKALQSALIQRPESEAAAASDALLGTFCTLLVNLIGASLTERLLRGVWDKTSGGHAARDISP